MVNISLDFCLLNNINGPVTHRGSKNFYFLFKLFSIILYLHKILYSIYKVFAYISIYILSKSCILPESGNYDK